MGFTGNIRLEAEALGWALLTGAALGVYYDLFRILRRVFPFGYAMIVGQDIFFWLSGAVGVFFGSVVVYQGQLRILFVLAALIGWGIYAATVGALLMTVADGIIGCTKKISRLMYNKLIFPLVAPAKSLLRRFNPATLFANIKKSSKIRKKKEENARKSKITA